MLILLVHNISNLAPISDYAWEARVNDYCLATGTVRGHRREDGWTALLQLIIEDAKRQEDEAENSL